MMQHTHPLSHSTLHICVKKETTDFVNLCDNGICILVNAFLIGEQESANVIKTAALVSGQMFEFYNLLVMCFLYVYDDAAPMH